MLQLENIMMKQWKVFFYHYSADLRRVSTQFMAPVTEHVNCLLTILDSLVSHSESNSLTTIITVTEFENSARPPVHVR